MLSNQPTGAQPCLVRVTDPRGFGGLAGFNREFDWLVTACRKNAPSTPSPVRLPGERGLARKRTALETGLRLNPLVHAAIEQLAIETSIALPPGDT